jgi:hypothetical protein
MSDKDLFWNAFSDELEKQGAAPILFRLGQFFSRLKGMATPALQKGVSALGKTRAGKYLGRSPRLSKFLGFAGAQAGIGAASEFGMMPFMPRRRIVEIAPQPEWPHYGGRR